ncbi:MAG: hypothetical protein LJE69_06455 [Thiohalocapsa sp.]|jgi:hypothetical protein|uniref:hypothetical protein n=1 Tax=Thiohalocapsa sp. TaxID=2497641 RepID=UPI0025F00ADC|nr:hypothetical protein [Thiohalocapsa sp.]MCG6940873.1 hypothetical protein [Thiohalocapsa sp.]
MSDVLEFVAADIPREVWLQAQDLLTASCPAAVRRIGGKPVDNPTYVHELGTQRFWTRANAIEALGRLCAGEGVELVYLMAGSMPLPHLRIGRFVVGHTRLSPWRGSVEDKDYKLELAKHNPPDGRQGSLFSASCQHVHDPMYGLLCIEYPEATEDPSVPAKIGFGVPTSTLDDWVMLTTLDELLTFPAHDDILSDKAYPVLRRAQRDSKNNTGAGHKKPQRE